MRNDDDILSDWRRADRQQQLERQIADELHLKLKPPPPFVERWSRFSLTDWIMDLPMPISIFVATVLMVLIGAAVVAFFAAPFVIYDMLTVDRISLRADEWACTGGHKALETYWIEGVEYTRQVNVCDEWRRR